MHQNQGFAIGIAFAREIENYYPQRNILHRKYRYRISDPTYSSGIIMTLHALDRVTNLGVPADLNMANTT